MKPKQNSILRGLGGSLLLGLMALTLSACIHGGGVQLGSFEIEAPDTVIDDNPFVLTVEAAATGGGAQIDFDGTVELSVDGGASITPDSLELTDGRATEEVTVGGTLGSVTITASAGGTTGSKTLTIHSSTELSGDAGDDAAEAIPDVPYRSEPDDYSAAHPELGDVYVSFNIILLSFELGTTVAEANDLLASIDAQIEGGIAGRSGDVPGILTVQVPAMDHAQMEALLEDLRADPRIAHAVQDALLETSVIPGGNGGNPPGWNWNVVPAGGNWGFELVRVPQMWNLNDALDASGSSTATGVFDVGFADTHTDLSYLDNQTPGNQADHGTHVAGTIGATYDNGSGVDGLNPFADLVVRTRDSSGFGGSTTFEVRQSFGDAHLAGFADLVRSRDDIKVINISMGYNWGPAGVDQDTNTTAQELVAEQGALFRTLLIILANEGDLPLVVTAAGNDSNSGFGQQQARWGSPFNYAALVLDPPDVFGVSPIVVVESLANNVGGTGGATRSNFSNVEAHISAPGSNILSTAFSSNYQTMSGTSMAAPHVTGLVSFLYTVDPDLTHEQVRELLFANSVAVDGDASNRIDAYTSVLDIDRIRGDDSVRDMLLDANGDGVFDEADFDLFLAGFADGAPDTPAFSRFDLNGDGLTGGDSTRRFDLDRDGSYTVISGTVESEEVDYNEASLTDVDILCYYGYSALYDGSEAGRSDGLAGDCGGIAVTLPADEPVVVEVEVELPDPTTGEVGADVMFNVDLSGSYSDDLDTFRDQAADIVAALESSLADVRVGLTSFVDAPCSTFGSLSSGDFGHNLDLPLTDDADAFQDALVALGIYSGGDGPESQLESMHQTMTGSGVEVTSGDCAEVADIEPSSAGWSTERLRFLIHSTDAPFHRPTDAGYPYSTSVDDLIATAQGTGTRIFILDSGGNADSAKNDIADQTGGEVFLLGSDSSGVVEAVQDAAEGSVTSATVKLQPEGDDAGFVESVDPPEFVDVDLTTTDFVTFEVTFVNSVEPGPEPQVFRFEFAITVDGAVIERRPVTVTIPAESE